MQFVDGLLGVIFQQTIRQNSQMHCSTGSIVDQEKEPQQGFLLFRKNNTAYNEKKIRHECVGETPTYLVWKQSH